MPGREGVKVTLIVQLPPAGTDDPQVLVWPKSPAFVPVTAMPAMVNVAFPVLLRVTGSAGLLVPRFWLPKVRLGVVRLTTGPPPVPLRLTV